MCCLRWLLEGTGVRGRRDLDAGDARLDELSRRARATAADERTRGDAVDAGAAPEGPSLEARVAAANRHARVELREVTPRGGGARTANPLIAAAGAPPPPRRDRARDRTRARAELRAELDRPIASAAPRSPPRAPPPDLLSGTPPAPTPVQVHPRVELALRNERALQQRGFGTATTDVLLGAEPSEKIFSSDAGVSADLVAAEARRLPPPPEQPRDNPLS